MKRATELHGERRSSYVEVVNYLLATYATNYNIGNAVKELDLYEQGHGASAVLCAKHLYTKALCCEIVYKEEPVMALFV